PELAASIQEFVRDNPDAYGARVPRLNFHLGTVIRHGGWYNKRHRLVRRGFGRWGGENPHDVIELNDGRVGPVLKGDLLHYSFRDLSHQLDTMYNFSGILAFTRVARGVRFSLLRLLFNPDGKFIEIYFLKLGFLVGMAGLITAINTSYAAFLRFAKIY